LDLLLFLVNKRDRIKTQLAL